jgi:hypothetical protein
MISLLLCAKVYTKNEHSNFPKHYYEKNAYRMNYRYYREQGWCIGSGAIEAAHRTLIQQRMKLSGQRWSPKGAKTLLKLRVAFKSNKKWLIENSIKKAA